MPIRSRQLATSLLVLTVVPCAFAQKFDESKWGKNSPGVELKALEGPRQHDSSGTILVYNLVGKGFPSELKYSLWGWIPGQKPQKAVEGVSFDQRGVLVCTGKPGYCQGSGPDDPINIKTTAVKGEPKRFAVVSDDGKVAGFAESVPFPIEATDKQCKLSVIRQTPNADMILLRATGFVPFELLNVSGQSGADQTSQSPTVGADGTWQAIVGNKAAGQTSGTTTLKVAGQKCTVTLSFSWGPNTTTQQ